MLSAVKQLVPHIELPCCQQRVCNATRTSKHSGGAAEVRQGIPRPGGRVEHRGCERYSSHAGQVRNLWAIR